MLYLVVSERNDNLLLVLLSCILCIVGVLSTTKIAVIFCMLLHWGALHAKLGMMCTWVSFLIHCSYNTVECLSWLFDFCYVWVASNHLWFLNFNLFVDVDLWLMLSHCLVDWIECFCCLDSLTVDTLIDCLL